MEIRNSNNIENISPVIGILCIDISMPIQKKYGEIYKSFISASYVKYLECSGARIVPIWIGKNEDYYRKLLSIIHGVLIPGGAIWFDDPEMGRAAYSSQIIYNIACEMNQNGTYLPIWGTCLGFQLLIYAANGGTTTITRCDCASMDESLPLDFELGFRNSKIFRNAPDEILEILKTEPVTYNIHKFCITKKILEDLNLSKDWQVITTNKDSNNLEFISTFEHTNLPFYGVQFHPEKSQFEFYPNDNVSHSLNAIKVGQYFSNFFIQECRKNPNNFNENNNKNLFIYNFPITYTGLYLKKWRECYLFEENIDYPKEILD